MPINALMALSSSPPIKILSGFFKSEIAVPSARNSGFESIEKLFESLFKEALFWLASVRIF